MKKITQKRLKELLRYDQETGVFTWIARPSSRIRVGDVAGHKQVSRVTIRIDGELHYAHRLAWLWMTGKLPRNEIDHKDMDGFNNRWENLRPATHAQNQHNRTTYRNNRSGLKGVRRNGRNWGAGIWINSQHVWLGTFATPELAHAAYAAAASRLHGEFARAV